LQIGVLVSVIYNVLIKNPNLIFIGAHLASIEWCTDTLSAWLDKFPNAAIDVAERICHLQLQAKKDWHKVRDFMIKYQDRIIYGSDVIYESTHDYLEIKERAHRVWKTEWNFLASDNVMEVHQFEGKFKGLALPDEVIIKIYRENALKWYPQLKNTLN